MASEYTVSRWLQDQGQKSPALPDSLHPADEFPLRTLSNPPSSSSDSDIESEYDGGRLGPSRGAYVAKLVHPPTPSMEETPGITHARRRSSSFAGAPGTSRKDRKKQRRRSGHDILEEGDDYSESDGDHSDGSDKTESTDLELDEMRSSDGLEDDEETGLTGRDRRRRRRRKRRNTRLDQRIVEDVTYTKEERKLANQTMMHDILINGVLIGLW